MFMYVLLFIYYQWSSYYFNKMFNLILINYVMCFCHFNQFFIFLFSFIFYSRFSHFCTFAWLFYFSQLPHLWGPSGVRSCSTSFFFLYIYWDLFLRNFYVSFHCYADNTQIYLSLQRNNKNALTPLLECLNYIKGWMSLNFLKLNENKMEIITFGLTDTFITGFV